MDFLTSLSVIFGGGVGVVAFDSGAGLAVGPKILRSSVVGLHSLTPLLVIAVLSLSVIMLSRVSVIM